MMRMNFGKQHIPWVMAAARAALGPVLIAGTACSWNGFALAGMVVGALVSDIYDGVLARRWRCDTAGVRLFDSMADTVFYLCTAIALWLSEPRLWRSYGGLLVVLLGMEAVRVAFDLVKFGRPASYHSYLAKLWGLVMAVGVIAVFALDRSNVLVPVALVLGILCNVEGLAMAVVFKYAGPGASANEVAIEYKNIRGYSYTSEVAYHLGVLPAIAVGLLKSRERRHFLTIRYLDSADVAQAAVFEVAKSDPQALLAVLRARAPQACGSPMLNCGYGQGNRPGGSVAPGQQSAAQAPKF
jgi:CDP-diacylglycerol--glycerol-3-phosphate 3-phosphatidyltransferase